MTTALVIIAVIAILTFVFRKRLNLLGLPCQFCGHITTPLNNMELREQQKILDYFRRREHRKPDADGVFVCRNCRAVHDDFSGEKHSREPDAFTCMTFCKVCGGIIVGCDLDNPDIRCPKCETAYRWEVHEESGFRFLMPPKGARILSEPSSREDLP